MCRDDVPSPFVEGSRLQRLRESIGPLFIRGHKYQADAAVVVRTSAAVPSGKSSRIMGSIIGRTDEISVSSICCGVLLC